MSVVNYGKVAVVKNSPRQVWNTYKARLIVTGQEEGCDYYNASQLKFKSNRDISVWNSNNAFTNMTERTIVIPTSGLDIYFTGWTGSKSYRFNKVTLTVQSGLYPKRFSSANGTLNFTTLPTDARWHVLEWTSNDPKGDPSPRIRVTAESVTNYMWLDEMYVTASDTL